MTFDEFRNQLDKIRAEHLKTHGVEMLTVEELYSFLDRREVIRAKKSLGARSLRGIKF